jgi:hypothetical protein
MNKLQIETSLELEKFLKILAEESVTLAKKSIAEDTEQDYYKSQMTKDKKRFITSNMSEQEKDEDEVDVANDDELEQIAPEEKEDIDITFFRIRDELNTIRSGRSLKDKNLKSELEQYVDRLSGNEKKILHTFLKSIGNIMTDEETGSSAKDPSDPPVALDVKGADSDKDGIDQSDDSEAPEAATSKKQKSKKSEIEDTTPPIRVGRQQTESIRDIVKKLMLS